MATRNVNKVILIGNLTKDPEIRYTPQNTAVANFSIATNRSWTVNGTEKEAVDFHNCVAWNKLAEICGQLLAKGTMVYVEGSLRTRNWVGQDGVKRYRTEVNVDEMIVLKNGKSSDGFDTVSSDNDQVDDQSGEVVQPENGDDGFDIDQLLQEIDSEE